jgi:hypothetical protein
VKTNPVPKPYTPSRAITGFGDSSVDNADIATTASPRRATSR